MWLIKAFHYVSNLIFNSIYSFSNLISCFSPSPKMKPIWVSVLFISLFYPLIFHFVTYLICVVIMLFCKGNGTGKLKREFSFVPSVKFSSSMVSCFAFHLQCTVFYCSYYLFILHSCHIVSFHLFVIIWTDMFRPSYYLK